MRHPLHIILAVLMLAAAVGCSRSADRRLVLADSLMWKNPDSSLAILTAINRDSLTGDENLAYHALLLTQAQFRCNGNCTSDTLINSALKYYSDNHNREHYTRSLLYKGAYYEFHSKDPIEAIKWYKQAEYNADSADYRNLAQINMRIATVYYINFATNGIDTEKYKNAYRYYKILGDKPMMLNAISHIGCLYRNTKKKIAIQLLKESVNIAQAINDTVSYYRCLNDLSMALFIDSCFNEAKNVVMKCYESEGKYATNAVHFNAANAYAMLHRPDSARLLLNMIDTTEISDYDKMMLSYAECRILDAEGSHTKALIKEKEGNSINEKISNESKRNSIFEIENLEDARFKQEKVNYISNMKWKIMFWTILSVILMIIVGGYIYRNMKYKRFVKDLKHNQMLMQKLIEDYNEKQQLSSVIEKEQLCVKEEKSDLGLLNFLNNYFITINNLLLKSDEMQRAEFVREIKTTLNDAGKDNHYWEMTRFLADERSGNLVTRLLLEHKDVIDAETNIICLTCLGYKNESISAITGYGKNSIKSIKTRIKNKIGLSIPLDAFIKEQILVRGKK